MINFDSPRGGISLVTEKGALTTSRLLVQNAIQNDSGVYTCAPSNTSPATAKVHILNGEKPAAMHHGACGKPLKGDFLLLITLILLYGLYLNQQK